jgi:hypothetical protein
MNKKITNDSVFMDNFLGKGIENDFYKEKEFHIDPAENEDFYNYVTNEEDFPESYIQKPYQKSKFFNYKALDLLLKDEPLVDLNSNVYICAFHVNQSGKLPFLQFVMNKYSKYLFGDILTFPCFSYTEKNNILEECESKLDEVVGLYKDDNIYTYVGHICDGCDVYMFYDITHFEFQTQELYRDDKMWLVLLDEIVNYQRVCNFEIHNIVLDFFRNNFDFCTLYDKNELPIESPIVCYSGIHESKLKFTAIFGVGKDETDGIVGPYYYFTTYEKSIKSGGWSKNYCQEFRNDKKITEDENGKYISGGIVRFAVFLGTKKVVMNYPKDDTDESLYKNEKLKDESMSFERQTTRISDYDGKWAESHDSVYIGKLETDDGKILTDAPYWVVKEYEQQTAISFHHIDKRTLGDKWNEHDIYYIK